MKSDIEAASPGPATKVPGQQMFRADGSPLKDHFVRSPKPDPVKLVTAVAKALDKLPPEPKTDSGKVLREVDSPSKGRRRFFPANVFRDGKVIAFDPTVTLAAVLDHKAVA